jgi:D-3-phosphoglycerate dehydrogenase
LILDFLDWCAAGPRPYDEALAAWRTSCPRLPIWEDAFDQGLVRRRRRDGEDAAIELTDAGRALLEERRAAR